MPEVDPHQRLFRTGLLLSFLSLVYMFLPFVAVLLTAAVLVAVSWPVFAWLSSRIGPIPAAILTTIGQITIVLVPATLMVWTGIREGVEAVEGGLEFVGAGGIDRAVVALEAWLSNLPGAQKFVHDLEVGALADAWSREALGTAAQRAGGWVTGAVQMLAAASIHLVVGLATMLVLYLQAPALLAAVRRTHWLPQEYLDRLFEVFGQFSRSVILGMLATTIGQGLVAALGFWLFGAPRVALLGMLTAVLSQVPFVGSAVVWVPASIGLALDGHGWRAAGLAVWSLVLTGSVDNVLKPLVYQQGTRVYPPLVLLSLLAGMTTFGPSGVLVGPLLLVLFMTLWTLYDRDVLHR
ncbi:MAG: AI-2E family transporter [Myxococcota bacterium]